MSSSDVISQRIHAAAARLPADGVCALAELFDLAAPRLVRFAAAISRNQHDAEDAVQSVLVRLTTDSRCLAGIDSTWSYLLRMVRNETLAQMRRSKRSQPAEGLEHLLTYCPVDEAQREESYRAVWQAIQALATEQAEVVVLKIWEEMTFVQISEVLELPMNTVASRYRYAMTKLTDRLRSQREAFYE